MPLPLVAVSFIGGIVAAITQFFISRAGSIIAGLGLTFIGVKSMEAFMRIGRESCEILEKTA